MKWGVFELAGRFVEPSVKRAVVLKLLERKLPPIEIARAMGISPSAVSRYIKGERGSYVDLLKIPEIAADIERLADSIVAGRAPAEEVALKIYAITLKVLANKYACGLHKMIDEGVNPVRCNICSTLFSSPSLA